VNSYDRSATIISESPGTARRLPASGVRSADPDPEANTWDRHRFVHNARNRPGWWARCRGESSCQHRYASCAVWPAETD